MFLLCSTVAFRCTKISLRFRRSAMHIPSCNLESDPVNLHKFIRQHPLGILTTGIESDNSPFLQSSHIPWIIDARKDDESDLGRLRGHLARANPQARAMAESVVRETSQTQPRVLARDVMILFNGLDHHVTPKFYKETKPSTGKVVPTWDYEAVEVYGKALVYVDPKAEICQHFLSTQIQDLSDHMESNRMGYERPWKVTDAPAPYVGILSKAIIGIEVEITLIKGRFKWSQEKPVGDRIGVTEGFKSMDGAAAAELAGRVEEWASVYDARKKARS